MRRSKTIYKLILSYIIVLVLPLLIMMPFYIISINSLNDEITRSNDILLNMIKLGTDVYVRDVGNMLVETASDESLQSVVSNPAAPQEAYEKLGETLKTIKNENYYIDDTYVMFGERDMVVCPAGQMSIRDYYSKYISQDVDSYFSYRRLMGKRYKTTFTTELSAGSVGIISAVLSVPFSEIENIRAQVVININMSAVINSIRQSEDFNIFVLNKDKIPLFTENFGRETELIKLLPAVKEDGVYGEGESKSYVSSIDAGFGDLRYFVVTPYAQYIKPLTILKWIIIILLVFCILFAIPIIKTAAEMQYRKVKKLLRLFEKEQTQIDEYDYLYNQVEEIITQKERLGDELRNKEPLLVNMYLQNLLKGRETPKAELPAEVLDFEKKHLVLVTNIENYQNIYFDTNHGLTELEKYQEAVLIVMNVMEELLSEKHKIYLVEIDDSVTAIAEAEEISLPQIEAMLGYLNEVVERYFGFSIRFASCEVQGRKIAESYKAAVRSLEYSMIMQGNSGGPLQAENATDLYYYPLTEELKIVGMMKNREFDGAKQQFAELIEINTVQRSPSAVMIRLLLSNMLNTMLKLITELETEKRESLNSAVLELSETQSVAVFQERLFRLVDAYEALTEQDERVNVEFKDRVDDYIREHYCDLNLSVQLVADYLGVNPSYLSRKFKEQFQTGILDYIYKIRIEKSKAILSRGKTVEETANQVGFATARAFSRAFQKYEGISPGQYKKAVN